MLMMYYRREMGKIQEKILKEEIEAKKQKSEINKNIAKNDNWQETEAHRLFKNKVKSFYN